MTFVDDDEIEEERRLAYVAVTRAKDKLFCTHAHERLLYGKTSYNRISRFLKEIPDGMVERTAEKARTPQSDLLTRSTFKKPPTPLSREMTKSPVITQTAKKPSAIRFSPGDTVKHPTFGIGIVLSAQNIGSDMLYEVAFDSVGTKKMMGTYAKLSPGN